ncbi:MAG: MFS transporter [Phycisphaerae bacterium]|nr:MFS transporter [Phycisphaerae bacterium]
MADAPDIPNGDNGSKLAGVFRSLRHRNFRLFFIGQSISLIGTWMQMLAVGWLVWRLTHSMFLLGLVPFIGRLPTLFLAPFVGVLVDRLDRHRLVIATQMLAMLQALALAALVFAFPRHDPQHLLHLKDAMIVGIILLQLLLGFINSVDIPARQSFVVQMIDRREDLNNAIALNSSMVNGARLVGPVIAGVMVAEFGEGVCFLLNGLSYIAVIAGLMMMHVQPNARAAAESHPLANLKEGFRYVFGFAPIRSILMLLALVSLTGQSYNSLLPIFADDILNGTSRTQGLLMAATGVGALAGAMFLATRRSVRGLGRVIGFAPAIMGVGLIGLGLSHWLWASLLIMPVIGVGMMVQTASSNTILQTIVDDDKRGRVMSFYSLAFMGMVPLGSLLAGTLAKFFGAPATVIIGGACCIAGSVWFSRKLPALRPLVHPIYVRKGIIPEVATGLQAASEQGGPASADLTRKNADW